MQSDSYGLGGWVAWVRWKKPTPNIPEPGIIFGVQRRTEKEEEEKTRNNKMKKKRKKNEQWKKDYASFAHIADTQIHVYA